MDILSRNDLLSLVNRTGKNCISLYMPTHRGAGARQDPIRFRNLLDQAHEMLIANGLRVNQADQLMEPAMRLLDSSDFWRHQSEGIAVFLTDGFFSHYRLPLSLPQMVCVNEHFAIKPLLPMFVQEGMIYVLAISKNYVRLLHGSPQSCMELTHPDIPANLDEVLKYDQHEKQVQWHTQTPPAFSAGGAKRAAFCIGQAALDKDVHKEEISRFCLQIDRGLRALLHDQHWPLVLASVEYIVPIYRQVNTYRHLALEYISGNPDRRSDDDLMREAWKLLRPQFQQRRQQAIDRYSRAMNIGMATANLSEIIPAACAGRIGVLLAGTKQPQWGLYNPDTQSVRLHKKRENGDVDLGDLAVVQTLLHGGQVMPASSEEQELPYSIAAIYRY